MLTQKHGKVEWKVPTKPVEMKKAVVAAGKPRKVGEVVEVEQAEFNHMVARGTAIPHLGEPVAKKKKSRKKDD